MIFSDDLGSQNICSALYRGVKDHHTLYLKTEKEKPTVGRVTFLSRVWHWNDSPFHQDRYGKIAEFIANELNQLQRMTPADADCHPTLLLAKRFVKTIPKEFKEDSRIKQLGEELLAAKLGINQSLFEHNPGFKEFSQKYVLYNYLMKYGHSLQIDEGTQSIRILANGEFLEWNSISADILNQSPPSTTPTLPWRYGMTGLQSKDMYQWTTLEPFMTDDPKKWGNQYGIAFCTCCIDRPRTNGDHTWIRLYTATGKIFSVGLYRPGKEKWFENYLFPLRIKKGYLMMPDVSEFWNVPIQILFKSLSETQFEDIVKAIEEEKVKNEHNFQLFQNNCTLWSMQKGEKANIQLPTKTHVLKLFTSGSLQAGFNKIPKIIKKVIIFIGTFFLNFLIVILGGTIVDHEVKQKNSKITPHITSLFDLFRSSKLDLYSPFKLAHEIRGEVDTWRQKKIAKLEKKLKTSSDENVRSELLEKIEQVPYNFPKSYLSLNP